MLHCVHFCRTGTTHWPLAAQKQPVAAYVLPAAFTQPCRVCSGWGGQCELIIGCTAKALDDALDPDFEEMAEVKWMHRNELRKCIAQAAADWCKPSELLH